MGDIELLFNHYLKPFVNLQYLTLIQYLTLMISNLVQTLLWVPNVLKIFKDKVS